MERHSQPPPDDFPWLWGVEDKLGLYIPKQKGVLALEGELDISPRRYLSGKLKSLFWLRTGRHTPCSSAAKQHRQLLLPDPHCSPSDSPQRQETASAHTLDRPKKDRFIGSFYDAEEVNKLFEVSKGTKLEFPILFGAFYGLRRSEALGLKWDAIDFENDSITIRHTVTSVTLDGKVQLVAADTTKTKSSLRTLPLVPFVKERLLVLKKEQENNRRLCGRSYHKQYAGYVCINEMGDLIKPHYVTEQFPKLLDANGLRRIRFHDLRHSCASLMLANGVPMKQIQDWLGHSDFSTTANIYAHLDYSTKLSSADAMLSGLGFQTEKA